MATKTLQTRFILKNDTENLWTSNNPVLLKGEIGIATDVNKIKIGNGTSHWNDLSYFSLTPGEVSTLIGNARDNVYIVEATSTQTDIEAITAEMGSETAKKADMAIVIRSIGETDKKSYTSYVYGDSSWEAMDGNYSAENVYLESNITMAGDYTAVGNLTKTKNGTATFETKGLSVAEAFTKIFTKTLQPTITAQPAVSLTAANNKAYEVGTTVTPTYNASLSAGSYTYGPATGITASSWSVTNNQSGDDKQTFTTASGSFNQITVGDSTNYTITATATYNDGAIAKDNVGGNSNPVVKISAGSKSKTSSAITGYRSWFTYVGTDLSTLTSAIIRGSSFKNKGAAGTNFNVDLKIPAGTKRVCIAIPASKSKSLSCVTDVDGMGLDVKANFTKQTVSVEGANGYTAVNYDVFVCENTAGLKATTYKVQF